MFQIFQYYNDYGGSLKNIFNKSNIRTGDNVNVLSTDDKLEGPACVCNRPFFLLISTCYPQENVDNSKC